MRDAAANLRAANQAKLESDRRRTEVAEQLARATDERRDAELARIAAIEGKAAAEAAQKKAEEDKREVKDAFTKFKDEHEEDTQELARLRALDVTAKVAALRERLTSAERRSDAAGSRAVAESRKATRALNELTEVKGELETKAAAIENLRTQKEELEDRVKGLEESERRHTASVRQATPAISSLLSDSADLPVLVAQIQAKFKKITTGHTQLREAATSAGWVCATTGAMRAAGAKTPVTKTISKPATRARSTRAGAATRVLRKTPTRRPAARNNADVGGSSQGDAGSSSAPTGGPSA